MPIGKTQTVGAGDSFGEAFMSGRLLATAALVGMDILTAPETTVLKAGRWVIPDTLKARTVPSGGVREAIGSEDCDAGNFLLPADTGQGSGPIRYGGVLVKDAAFGAQCLVQTEGLARLLMSGPSGGVSVGDVVIICDGPAAARNARGTGFGITPNVNTGVIGVPTAGATVGTTATNVYTVIGEVVKASATAPSVAVPQISLVRLYGIPIYGIRLVSS